MQVQQPVQLGQPPSRLFDLRAFGLGERAPLVQRRRKQRAEQARVLAQLRGHAGAVDGVGQIRVGILRLVAQPADGHGQHAHHGSHLLHRHRQVRALARRWRQGQGIHPLAGQLQGPASRRDGLPHLPQLGGVDFIHPPAGLLGQAALQGIEGQVGSQAGVLQRLQLGRVSRLGIAQNGVHRPPLSRRHLGR